MKIRAVDKEGLLGRRVLVIMGGYGAGKTQIAINLSLQRAQTGQSVALVDLDLVNPYFRSREISGPLLEEGVKVIRPEGDLAFAENPSLPAQIAGVLRDRSTDVLLDVGGNENGATIVGRYHDLLQGRDVGVLQVVNIFRPFSMTVAEIEELRLVMENRSRLNVQGWINNSNLQEWTTLADWEKSGEVMADLVSKSRIPLVGCGVNPEWAEALGLVWQPEWIPVKRYLKLGWKGLKPE
ncbi:P-loop containing nucleoside triphosphate hydrolase [Acididesulfobacillus acetoxydans]|uniref:P-loop containing nucleoside triphosphate hydrolase n=1 Tax=Acididesulfobacillus acetoxydans TaxID=1561005 RepID=A0A8S0VVQ9_9FIRM|nr:hypothetical protein [Acididesulfobacillus acetoxydans]CAA7599973.1 P-loop containing nucleoside triphosphate hydrolase [Acididesulfobacillus acetoxydans]CEJ07935.1 P-loop containing nucleoside triphosphate hydrolase [Acididesulfobacillus acetoxydans]